MPKHIITDTLRRFQDGHTFGDDEQLEAARIAISNSVRAAMEASAGGESDAAIKALMSVAKGHEIGAARLSNKRAKLCPCIVATWPMLSCFLSLNASAWCRPR